MKLFDTLHKTRHVYALIAEKYYNVNKTNSLLFRKELLNHESV